MAIIITRTVPTGGRFTRFSLSGNNNDAVGTQWYFLGEDGFDFTITSTSSGAVGENVISASLTVLNIWLPPSHTYSLKARQRLGTYIPWGDISWSAVHTVVSRGLMNSSENYAVLNSGIQTIEG